MRRRMLPILLAAALLSPTHAALGTDPDRLPEVREPSPEVRVEMPKETDGGQVNTVNATVCFLQDLGDRQSLTAFTDTALPGDSSAVLKLDREEIGLCTAVPRTVGENACQVRYIFMIDVSGSISKKVRGQIRELAEEVTRTAEGSRVRYGLAVFGDEMKLISADLDGDALLREIKNLSYRDKNTNLAQGMWELLDELKVQFFKSEELVNVIWITDAEPDPSEEGRTVEEVRSRLAANSSVLVHTVFASREARGEVPLDRMGRGSHGVLSEKTGTEITEFVNGMTVLRFPISGMGTQKVRTPASGEIEVDGGSAKEDRTWIRLSNVMYQGEEILPERPSGSALPGEAAPVETAVPSAQPSAGPDDPAESAVPGETAAPGETAVPGETDPAVPETEQPEEEPSAEEAGGKEKTKKLLLAVLILVPVVLILVILLRSRRNRNNRGTRPVEQTGGNRIYMKLEVESGTCVSSERDFYLEDELLIGSGRTCDVIFREPEVAPEHVRIYMDGALIFLEDLGTETGTALGRMRLHEPNRLRSGDEISIGSVCFRFLF